MQNYLKKNRITRLRQSHGKNPSLMPSQGLFQKIEATAALVVHDVSDEPEPPSHFPEAARGTPRRSNGHCQA